MGRKARQKVTVLATRDDDVTYFLFKLGEDNKFNFIDALDYDSWDIEDIYKQIRDSGMFEEDCKLQLILQRDFNLYSYRSCNANKVYRVSVEKHEIDCNCDWATLRVKTGRNGEPCHHVKEIDKWRQRFVKEVNNEF